VSGPFLEKTDVFLPGRFEPGGGETLTQTPAYHRHNSMGDFGNPIDLAISRSRDAGRTWSAPEVLFAEEGTSAVLGSIFEDRAARTVFVSFWKMPVGVAKPTWATSVITPRREAASG
jgi:hypothetical protein